MIAALMDLRHHHKPLVSFGQAPNTSIPGVALAAMVEGGASCCPIRDEGFTQGSVTHLRRGLQSKLLFSLVVLATIAQPACAGPQPRTPAEVDVQPGSAGKTAQPGCAGSAGPPG